MSKDLEKVQGMEEDGENVSLDGKSLFSLEQCKQMESHDQVKIAHSHPKQLHKARINVSPDVRRLNPLEQCKWVEWYFCDQC